MGTYKIKRIKIKNFTVIDCPNFSVGAFSSSFDIFIEKFNFQNIFY